MKRGEARKRPPPMVSDLGGLPIRNAFLVTAVEHTFQRLGVAAALLDASDDWHAINSHRNVTAFELAHGRGPERHVYNDGAVSRARRLINHLFRSRTCLQVRSRRLPLRRLFFIDLFVECQLAGLVGGSLRRSTVSLAARRELFFGLG